MGASFEDLPETSKKAYHGSAKTREALHKILKKLVEEAGIQGLNASEARAKLLNHPEIDHAETSVACELSNLRKSEEIMWKTDPATGLVIERPSQNKKDDGVNIVNPNYNPERYKARVKLEKAKKNFQKAGMINLTNGNEPNVPSSDKNYKELMLAVDEAIELLGSYAVRRLLLK